MKRNIFWAIAVSGWSMRCPNLQACFVHVLRIVPEQPSQEDWNWSRELGPCPFDCLCDYSCGCGGFFVIWFVVEE